ncbi:MAG: hypothetical protein ACI9Y1_002765 [Lentisphaeria bacterium]|jgi:hypothetical protein
MLAINTLELKGLIETIGFELTLLEHNFSKLLPWQGKSCNVLFVCFKPEV